jgi:hypothetical protein
MLRNVDPAACDIPEDCTKRNYEGNTGGRTKVLSFTSVRRTASKGLIMHIA